MSIFLHKCIVMIVVISLVENLLNPVWATSEFTIYARILAENGIIDIERAEIDYRLGDFVSRAEVAKIAVRIAGLDIGQCRGDVYSDVSSEAGNLCSYIETAADAEIVSKSYPRFRVSDTVTRAELIKMLLIANTTNLSSVPAGFSDTPSSLGDLVGYINAGVGMGCIRASTFFRPNAPATRAEVFKITTCVMAHKKSSLPEYTGRLVWSDEFSGTGLDLTKWNMETGSDGWGNNELQNYTASGNISVIDSKLIVEARKENNSGAQYSSARINTHLKASWLYGKIEAKIKLPTGQGIWPAFWMLGEDIDGVGYPLCGEMDIAEMIGGISKDDGTNNEVIIYGTIHRPNLDQDSKASVKSIGASYLHPIGTNWSDDYHIYGIEWDEKTVKHSVDGHIYKRTDISSKIDGFEVFHKPFYIVLNMAVGGNWPGPPDETTGFPQKMQVDWVRVFQK